jgi:leader peptidase (prepilin peptidase)/N-methyltransferase
MPHLPAASDFASTGVFDHYAAVFMMLPDTVQYAFAAVFGLVIGSFLTVVVHRLPIMLEQTWQDELRALAHSGAIPDVANVPGVAIPHLPPDESNPATVAKPYNLWWPGSGCTSCGHRLRAWENIPLLGYLALRGRCSACGVRISPRYPLVEIAAAALAMLSLWCFGPG